MLAFKHIKFCVKPLREKHPSASALYATLTWPLSSWYISPQVLKQVKPDHESCIVLLCSITLLCVCSQTFSLKDQIFWTKSIHFLKLVISFSVLDELSVIYEVLKHSHTAIFLFSSFILHFSFIHTKV